VKIDNNIPKEFVWNNFYIVTFTNMTTVRNSEAMFDIVSTQVGITYKLCRNI